MANYYASARSNYFAVKDREAFDTWADYAGLEVLTSDHHDDRVMIAPKAECDSGWPAQRLNPDTNDWEEFDLCGELWSHLLDYEVAVLFEVGSEKLRYLTGFAVAVSWEGEIERLDLNDIYGRAAEAFGIPVSSISVAEH